METTSVAWVLVADGEGARLLQATATKRQKALRPQLGKATAGMLDEKTGELAPFSIVDLALLPA